MKANTFFTVKIFLVLITVFSFVFNISASNKTVSATDFETIMQRIRENEWTKVDDVTTFDNNIDQIISLLVNDEKFSDIDYANTAQTSWKPLDHMTRLVSLSTAYTLSASRHYGSSSLQQQIVKLLQFWYDTNPQSTNWWYAQIGVPQRMGVTLILMRAGAVQVPVNLENSLITRMELTGGRPDQSGSQGTGANKIDIATHWVYRGCLTANHDVTNFGVQQVYLPIEYTTGEGIQQDVSYFQHGQQLYTGGYGFSMLSVLNMASFTQGTVYYMPSDKLAVLLRFTKEGVIPMIRGKYFLYNPLGRGLSRPNAQNMSSFSSLVEKAKTLDAPINTAIYDAALNRLKELSPASYGVNSKHTHFWRADYSLYSTPDYTFDVRMVSTRTLRNENGNGENIKGYFLSDGANAIVVDGNEYYNIFPVWDWTKIPGITAPQLTTIPLPAEWGTSGSSTFAGGVSDGVTGITTYALNDNSYSINTSANKSWFFFGNEVLCLGSAIKSTSTQPINTTINQCLLDGDVIASSAGVETTLAKGDYPSLTGTNWILHDKVGYVFPKGGNVKLFNNTQSGTWKSINTSGADGMINLDVFKLWFDHGVAPVNADYAYIVLSNKTVEQLRNYDASNIQIKVSSDSAQVIYHKLLDTWYFVFNKAASYTNGQFTVRTDVPCTFMLKNVTTSSVSGWLADPSQNKNTVKIRFVSDVISGEKQLTTSMPVSPYTGSTVAFTIDQNTTSYLPNIVENIYTIADSYVNDGANANTNYGSAGVLLVKLDGVGYQRQSFLKFDLSSVNSNTIISAKLRLNVKAVNTNYTATNWKLNYVDDDSWAENAITWNNKPATTSTIGQIKPLPAGSVAEFDITSTVQMELAKTSKLLSLQLVSTVTDSKSDAQFYSKEDVTEAVRPRIVIERPNVATFNQKVNLSGNDFVLLGNPVKKGESAVLKANISKNQEIFMEIFDVNGRKVSKSDVYQFTADTQYIKFNTTNLDAGIYFINISDKSRRKTVKLIVR